VRDILRVFLGPLFVASIFLGALSSIAAAKVPQTEAERTAAIQSLRWRDGEQLLLPISHGTLRAPGNIRQLQGADAVALCEAINGTGAPPGMEAALYDPKAQTLVFYQKIADGYVRLDDWGDVDADAMLKVVSDNTEADNIKRRNAGLPALHVLGWLERPHLDNQRGIVSWAFELRDDEAGPLVNSIVLVLGRDGFEKLTWAGTRSTLRDGLLTIAQGTFDFPQGAHYYDHQTNDKVAEYGIAGLVAAVLGVKAAAKFGLFAALAVFAKKFGVLLVVGLGAAFAWLKRSFSRSKDSSAPPPLPPASP